MDTQYARPLNEERDKTVPIRCLGFGWLWFSVIGSAVYAPAIVRVRPTVVLGTHDPTSSMLTVLGCEAEFRVPGSPAAVVDAIVDAVGGTVFHPMHQPPPGAISHQRKP
jgi:hypothetical protein